MTDQQSHENQLRSDSSTKKVSQLPSNSISQSHHTINDQSSTLGQLQAQQFIRVHKQKLKQDPMSLITDKTSRQMLFQIAYLLEEENKYLCSSFEANKIYIIQDPNVEKKYALNSATKDERQAIIRNLKEKNAGQIGQVRLLQMYKEQKRKLIAAIESKRQRIELLQSKKKQKQEQSLKLNEKLRQNAQRLVKLKQKRNRLYEDIYRKKNNEKLEDSGAIDRLLGEYYETIKEVLDQDESVERINKNTKIALSRIGKGKPPVFSSFLEGLENTNINSNTNSNNNNDKNKDKDKDK